jgi:hypothetical protein
VRILVDQHHADLLEAMHRLFEDRLGLEVYVPTGMAWFDAGYWSFGRHHFGDVLARQYLETATEYDGFHDRRHRLITLDEFRALGDWAAVVATVQENQDGFARLAREAGARYVYQVGNTGQWIDWSLEPLVLNSSEAEGGIRMHQEFDVDGAFAFTPYEGSGHTIASFVNAFPMLPCWPVFEYARRELPDWTMRVHGHHGPDGFLKPTTALAGVMRATAFGWHDKVTGDGFGHVIHQWAAIGRPLIGHASHYSDKVAADLWEDGVTCVDLDRHSLPDALDTMRAIASDPVRHAEMCRAIRARLDARVDFAAEAQAVGDALGLAVPA